MGTLLIEMPSGVAGDMLLAALLDLGGDLDRLQVDLAGLGLGPLAIHREQAHAGGIRATRVNVAVPQEAEWALGHDHAGPGHHPTDHTHQHHGHDHPPAQDHLHDHAQPHTQDHVHTHQPDPVDGHGPHRPYAVIRALLDGARLPERVRDRAQRTFRLLAEAEGLAHGIPAADVHFHEVGSLDAIVDVVGCCLLLEQLAIDRVLSGPFTLGSGTVRCAHGRMPVPVPAVVNLLAARGAPQRRLAEETGELTTPTGAALVCALADAFAVDEVERVLRTGYGVGHKQIPGLVNLLRCSLVAGVAEPGDRVVELRCVIDDASGEELAELRDALLAAGARDAWLAPILMKKGRPGHELVVLADPPRSEDLATLLLDRGPAIGLRRLPVERRILPRRRVLVEVAGHDLALKVVTASDGSRRAKPEADDIARIATATGLAPSRLRREALAAWQAGQVRTDPGAPPER